MVCPKVLCSVINDLIECELDSLEEYEKAISFIDDDPELVKILENIMGTKCIAIAKLRTRNLLSGCNEPSSKYQDVLKMIDNNDNYW